MRLPSHHGRTETDVAMTPMIDVVFQLLIFFICTANFQLEEELLPMGLAAKGSLQADSPPEEMEPEPHRVVVRATRADGRTQWIVNEQPIDSLAGVQGLLRAATTADALVPVTLDVAGDVPLGDMIDVYDLCRITGLQKIEFAVEAN
jgi:biopolymer transport protein ExbD